jgi:hypothetical protein
LGFLETISQTSLVRWVAESDWGYPIVLTAHALGMAMVVGIMLMFDLRVLGFAARFPLSTARQYFPVAWMGFAVNLVSGTLLFLANYTAFLHNVAFITKISLLCLAALATVFLSRIVFEAAGETSGEIANRRAKLLAVVCLIFWLGAITAGRIVGYTSLPE